MADSVEVSRKAAVPVQAKEILKSFPSLDRSRADERALSYICICNRRPSGEAAAAHWVPGGSADRMYNNAEATKVKFNVCHGLESYG